jgi:hypothetical protein
LYIFGYGMPGGTEKADLSTLTSLLIVHMRGEGQLVLIRPNSIIDIELEGYDSVKISSKEALSAQIGGGLEDGLLNIDAAENLTNIKRVLGLNDLEAWRFESKGWSKSETETKSHTVYADERP